MYEFPHVLGGHVVPSDGSYPLGMGGTHVRCTGADVEVFERRRHVELLRRSGVTADSGEEEVELCLPETRQFDYRRGTKNMLYRFCSETQRMGLLKDTVDPEHHHSSGPKSPSSGPSAGGHHGNRRSGRRSRSGSQTEHGHPRRGSGSSHPRTLSQSELDEILANPNSPAALIRRLEEEAGRVQRELEQLRDSRSEVGCDCHRPKNFNKYNERRLKDELRKRGLPTEHRGGRAGKAELAERLREAVESGPVCGRDCPCVKEGVDCHADACGCWQEKGAEVVREACQKTCGNGLYFYDSKEVKKYRRTFLKTTCC